MEVEIDQSGKFDQTDRPTVVAMANGLHHAIRISATQKRKCLGELRRRRSDRQERTTLYIVIFATLVYLLVRDHIRDLNHVAIDTEFSGHEGTIKTLILNLCRRRGIIIHSDAISFRQIGRKSAAHDLALKVFQGRALPDRNISADEVLAEFGK